VSGDGDAMILLTNQNIDKNASKASINGIEIVINPLGIVIQDYVSKMVYNSTENVSIWIGEAHYF